MCNLERSHPPELCAQENQSRSGSREEADSGAGEKVPLSQQPGGMKAALSYCSQKLGLANGHPQAGHRGAARAT